MSDDATSEEPPRESLAWLTWYSTQITALLDLTPAERAFAIDKGSKLIDFAMRGFWKKHEAEGIRHLAPAAACAYAMAWLEKWAETCKKNA